jgi:NADP-dependent 3-hydroxy acid dehydrogenase YdfG
MIRRASNKPLRVVVSGAAEEVGFACASAFAERGAELILADTDGVALTRASDELGCFSRFCDVVSEASIDVFAADIVQAFGSIDVLINASGAGYVRSLGMMRMTRAMLPLLRKATGRRLIVNVAPVGGFSTADGMFPYAGSREGFHRLSEAMMELVKGSSIRIATMTPRLRPDGQAGQAGQYYQLQRVDAEDLAERVVDLVGDRLSPRFRSRSAQARKA